METAKGLASADQEKIDSSIVCRKPTYLASLLVDVLKDNGWNSEDIHFLGVEIINESGML